MSLLCVRQVLKYYPIPAPGRMLIIQHLLRDTEEFVCLAAHYWDIVGVVGIPYSAKSQVVNKLKMIVPLYLPKTAEDVSKIVSAIVKDLKNSEKSVFILDMGGTVR